MKPFSSFFFIFTIYFTENVSAFNEKLMDISVDFVSPLCIAILHFGHIQGSLIR